MSGYFKFMSQPDHLEPNKGLHHQMVMCKEKSKQSIIAVNGHNRFFLSLLERAIFSHWAPKKW
jgi:hypothetical protein